MENIIVKEKKVQKVLENWFEERRFEVQTHVKRDAGNKIDLVAKATKEEWYVEAKGDYNHSAAQYNVNFDTALGQICKSIDQLDRRRRYAIAIPFTRTEHRKKLSYRQILPKYSRSRVFESLNISLLLVHDNRPVEVIEARDVRSFLSSLCSTIQSRR